MLNAKIPKISLHIVILRTTSIGDVILASACLDALAKLPIDAQVTWVGREPGLSLLRASYPEVNFVTLSEKSQRRDVFQLFPHPPHLIVDLQRSLRSRRLVDEMKRFWKEQKPVVVAMKKKQILRGKLLIEARLRGRTAPLPERAISAPHFQYEMAVDALCTGLKKFLTVEDFDLLRQRPARPRLAPPKSEKSPWSDELSFGTWLAIAPGAKHETKKAPLSLFLEILEALRNDYSGPVNLLFVGDEADRADALKLIDGLRWPHSILNLCGKLSIAQTQEALCFAKAILCNDSSLGHLAEALGKQALVLFGPTVEGFGFGPHLPGSQAFSSHLGCRPCSKHGKSPCRYGDQFCFSGISPKKVASSLQRVLTEQIDFAEASSSRETRGRIDGAWFRGQIIETWSQKRLCP